MGFSTVQRLSVLCFFIFTFLNLIPTADLTPQTGGDGGKQGSDAIASSTPASISASSIITTSTRNNALTTVNSSPTLSTKVTTIKNNTPKKKEIESIIPEPPTIQVRLAGESLKLNVTVLEKVVEFSLMLNSSSKIGEVTVSASKRLLLALENDHFNVDVISVPLFTAGKKGDEKNSFGKKVEDWGWNKRNGILLQDNTQNYKWIASGSENDSTIFVTFQRKWQTCDVQDIHFGLSPIKIWWLLDTEEKKIPTKYENARMVHKSEKQMATASPSGESNSTTVTNNTNTTMSTIEEVEVLKSIQESNFQGPVNFTFAKLLKNVTTFFIKGCRGPSTQFQCNSSDIPRLQSANHSDFLSVAQILLQNDEFKRKVNTQECSIAIDYSKGGNEKQFQALFGFPNKNQGTSVKLYEIPGIILLMIMMVQIFWASFKRISN